MITIKLQTALLHPSAWLEIDEQEFRFRSGIFKEPLASPAAETWFVDPELVEPDSPSVPAIIPRIPILRTGAEFNHRPNTTFIFGSPLPLPPAKLVQVLSLPFSVKRDRWIDGMVIGCSKPDEALEQLRGSPLRATPSIGAALCAIYGAVDPRQLSSDQIAADVVSGRNKSWYQHDPVKRGDSN